MNKLNVKQVLGDYIISGGPMPSQPRPTPVATVLQPELTFILIILRILRICEYNNKLILTLKKIIP